MRGGRWLGCISTAALVAVLAGQAAAQPPSGPARPASDRDFLETIFDLVVSLSDRTRDTMFDFLEQVELLDAETEIDRLVGNPWELNDSTAYKLSLLPLHIQYPTYQQLVRQMTRLDDLRSQRIHSVTPDSVELIALRFDSLVADRLQEEALRSLLRHFNVREMVDLGVFALSHQPFFPETDADWQHSKRAMAESGGALATAAVMAGAAFDVGAFGRSGTLKRWPDDGLRLGWYGGFRRFGFRFQPHLRAGLTGQLPGMEVSAGLAERVRPAETDRRRALELAVREGWLSRLTRPSGWDAFFEGAMRRVLSAEPKYGGEVTTGRAGLFAKRLAPLRLPDVVFRSSAEMETDFGQERRFAVGLGLENTRTGLATVLQTSRTAVIVDGSRTPETRGGLFFAGTMEPPTKLFTDEMQLRGRLLIDEWESIGAVERRLSEARLLHAGGAPPARASSPSALEAMGRDLAALEAHVARLAERLADYLEARRVAYSVLRWQRTEGDLHGPVDPEVLQGARAMVLARLEALAVHLGDAERVLKPIRQRFFGMRESIGRLEGTRAADDPALAAARSNLAQLDETWREESERVNAKLRAYEHYGEAVRRIAAASRLVPRATSDPVDPRLTRRLLVLTARPLR